MINSQYTALAEFYDALNREVDYDAWADFLCRTIKKYGREDTSLVLDLACGTGTITRKLAHSGFDMIGVDASWEMLDIARSKSTDADGNILWLCQDMRGFELYGTVGAVICCLDSINYLLSTKDIEKCFSLVHNYCDPDGIFIFDINSPYKFNNIYSNNSFVLEDENVFCVWQNYFNNKTKICDFYLSMFSRQKDGRYVRQDEEQKERCYSDKTVRKLLNSTGFEVLACGCDFEFSEPKADSERLFYVAKAIKS